jgi:DNA-binding XRE family transcriptional regulator
MLTFVSIQQITRIHKARDFGALIRSARHARGFTQVGLAERANISRTALQLIEDGRSPSLTTAIKLLRILSLDLAVLSREGPLDQEKLRGD